jgi:hypothetical protein
MAAVIRRSAIRRSAIKLGALTVLLFALIAPLGAHTDNDGRFPDLGDCQDLQAPAGSKVAFVTYAEGVQIYRWNGTSWAFVAPEAVLYSGDGEDDEAVGIHYAGPTWESGSGSKVRAAVVEKCTPDPAAIPWLLLKAVASEGPGIFHRVSHIQRLYTVGGLAPADPGDVVGEEARVPYATWYVFYREQ